MRVLEGVGANVIGTVVNKTRSPGTMKATATLCNAPGRPRQSELGE